MAELTDSVALHARLQPERTAARDLSTDRIRSYRALDRDIAYCVAALQARGIGRGDRVAALARNCTDLIVLHFACARLGALYVPLNWRLAAPELRAMLDDAEPALLLGDGSLAELGLDGVALTDFAVAAGALAPVRPPAPDRAAPSLILYTSGTSGRPKGVLLSERQIEQTAINFSVLGRVNADSAVLCDAPMFHVIGLLTNIRPALMRGGTLLISDGFQPARTLARLGDERLRVTHYFCVPQMAAALRADPGFDATRLRGLTAIFSGGAPHSADAIRPWLDDGIAIADGFGMSEAGTVSCMPLDLDLIRAHAGAAGFAPPGIDIRLVDARDADCAGQPGELLVRGANVTSGYWRRPAETEAAFTADGWLRTGDIARIDADGYLWLVDRKKDMFISGGENVYPVEIEAALAAHPDILEAAVVGVADARWGEVGHLFLVPRDDRALDGAAVLAFLATRLARYKLPRQVSVLASLPRSSTGKILKAPLRRLANGDAPA